MATLKWGSEAKPLSYNDTVTKEFCNIPDGATVVAGSQTCGCTEGVITADGSLRLTVNTGSKSPQAKGLYQTKTVRITLLIAGAEVVYTVVMTIKA